MIAFPSWNPRHTWSFLRTGGQTASIGFEPHLSINSYPEIAALLVSGAGIGEPPPMGQIGSAIGSAI
jgi:hypothetical protein